MNCTIADLRCHEVINICTGDRLGYVEDVLFNTQTGRVASIIVPKARRFLGIFGERDDHVIPWECIRQIGNDVILVEVRA